MNCYCCDLRSASKTLVMDCITCAHWLLAEWLFIWVINVVKYWLWLILIRTYGSWKRDLISFTFSYILQQNRNDAVQASSATTLRRFTLLLPSTSRFRISFLFKSIAQVMIRNSIWSSCLVLHCRGRRPQLAGPATPYILWVPWHRNPPPLLLPLFSKGSFQNILEKTPASRGLFPSFRFLFIRCFLLLSRGTPDFFIPCFVFLLTLLWFEILFILPEDCPNLWGLCFKRLRFWKILPVYNLAFYLMSNCEELGVL